MEYNQLLLVKDLAVNFGGLKAIANVSFTINTGELMGLIGPNGAGKTTLFNAFTGLAQPAGGQIIFKGQDLINKKSHYISRQGIARTFQNIRLFKSLTTLENLRTAYHQNMQYSMLSGVLKGKSYQQQEKEALEQAKFMLETVGLSDHAQELSVNLSYGDQRKLEIARALVTKPDLLLLDEPAAGMNPAETQDLLTLIAQIRNELQVTIMLIEHDMNLVMKLCERVLVLDYGILIAEGTTEEIKSNERVIQAYLGADV